MGMQDDEAQKWAQSQNATFSAYDHCLCAGLPTDRKVGLALEDDFRPFPWRRSHQTYTSRRFARGRQHG